jgi:GT2 family glycosyltransferase
MDETSSSMSNDKAPSFSVIIPSLLRHDNLRACLRSLLNSDYPHDRFDVIVVDRASGMPPRAVLAPFAEKLNLAMIELGSSNLAFARNAGARHAQGEYLVFMNEDCALTADWMGVLAAAFTIDPDSAVVGRTVNALPGKFTSEASQVIFDYHSLLSRRNRGSAEILSAANLAVPKAAFRELGGFDESEELSHVSEREFSDRWLQSGRFIRFIPEAVVLQAHTPTMRGFLKAHFERGAGDCQIARKRVEEENSVSGYTAPRVRELMQYPFDRRAGWRAPFLSIYVALAESARALGSRSARLRIVR